VAKESRWLRLNVDWDDSPWLFTLSEGSQLAWIKFLCYVKSLGTSGRVRALEPLIASRKWGMGEESVSKMLQAGVNDGAIIVENGYWVVVNWSKYQGRDETNAERQKRYRESRREPDGPQKEASNAVTSNGTVTDSNAVTLSRDRDSDIDRDNTKTKTTQQTREAVEPPRHRSGDELEDAWNRFIKAYPFRSDESPSTRLKNQFTELWKARQDLESIIAGAGRYREFVRAFGTESQFIARASNWLRESRWEAEYTLPDPVPDSPDDPDYRTFDPGLGRRPKAYFEARDMPLPIYLVPHAVGHVEEVRRFLAKHGEVGRKLLESEGIEIPSEVAS